VSKCPPPGRPENKVIFVNAVQGYGTIWNFFQVGVVGGEIEGVIKRGFLSVTTKENLTTGFTIEQFENPRITAIAYWPRLREKFAHRWCLGTRWRGASSPTAVWVYTCPDASCVMEKVVEPQRQWSYAIWIGRIVNACK